MESLGLSSNQVSVFEIHDRWSLIKTLKEVRKKHGHIGALELSGHGFPGSFHFEDDWMDGRQVFNMKLTDVFSQGASIIFNSCLTGQNRHYQDERWRDSRGGLFSQLIGRAWLDQGGFVVSAHRTLVYTKYTNLNLLDKEEHLALLGNNVSLSTRLRLLAGSNWRQTKRVGSLWLNRDDGDVKDGQGQDIMRIEVISPR